jgi:Uma2 family endonuclease
MAVAKRERMSTVEFEARFADGETRAELLRNEVILMSPATSLHGIYTMRVSLPIAQFVEEHALGVVCGAETGFVIQHADGAESVLAPDMAYIAAERIPDPLPEGFWRISPDLVVEIRSRSESQREVAQKATLWLEAGARLVWYVDPFRQQVSVYRADGTEQTLSLDDTLSGEDVLPGFELPLRRIFRPVRSL